MKQSNLSVVIEMVKAYGADIVTKQAIADIQAKLSVSPSNARVYLHKAMKAIDAPPTKASKKVITSKVVEAIKAQKSDGDSLYEAALADGVKLTKEEFNRQRAIFANMFGGLI